MSWRYIARRLLQTLFTMLFVVAFSFFLFRVMPGDPVRLLTRQRGVQLSPEAQAALAHDLGLDKPIPSQFAQYVGDVFRGDMGNSFIYQGRSVMSVFLDFLWPTLILVGTATVLMTVIGLYLGIKGGWRRGGKLDLGSMGVGMTFYSAPDFWIGMMLLILFSTFLGWLPSGGFASPNSDLTGIPHLADVANHMVLPVITLVLGYFGEYYLIMRSSLLDVLGEDYITTVRAKGIGENQVLWRHAARNALLPTVSLIALGFGFVISGVVTVEVVFSYPGLGQLFIDAFDAQDYQLLQCLLLFSALAVLLSNLVADLVYGMIDPRVQVE